MARFKTVRNTLVMLMMIALLVIGEEKSILDGAEVICSYGICDGSWGLDAMISPAFRQLTV